MRTRVENSKKILEFMNVKVRRDGHDRYSWNDGVFFMVSENSPEKVLEAMAEYVKYDTDWNLLMAVVREISLREVSDKRLMGVVTIFNLGRTVIQCYKNEVLMHTIDCMDVSGTKPTFTAICEYIEWYNQNK